MDWTRRHIILAYWAAVFLALPFWWYTTSIERLSLPTTRVLALAGTELRLPVDVKIDISDSRLSQELQRKQSEKFSSRSTGVHVNFHGQDWQSDSRTSYTVVHAPGRPTVRHRTLSFPFDDNPHSISHLSDVISTLILPYFPVQDQVHHVVQYAPRYRLAFSLLNEDAAAGIVVTNWDISRAISDYLSPILDKLSVLHNFTIESQVQFHAPLAFNPKPLSSGGYGLSREDLTVFVNSAEWTLSSSISSDPVIHFVIFIPSAFRPSLNILNADGTPSASMAFLVPQWGGIVIHNLPPGTDHRLQLSSAQLEPVFTSFSNQLLVLLGIPSLPPSITANVSDTGKAVVTDWQLDTLMRQRILENFRSSQDTLSSIIKLVDQIRNMPVRQDVKKDVYGALDALDNVFSVSTTSLSLSLLESSRAMTLASRAFFNPGMLALLYFPAEHKYAVYTPLFASAIIPLIGAAVREISAWRRSRRRRTLADDVPQTVHILEPLDVAVKSD